jgi:hypothetical protein
MEGTGGPLAEFAALFADPSTPNAPLLFETEGVYVKPDKGRVRIRLGSFEMTETTIGTRQWRNIAGITLGPDTIPAPTADDLSLAAAFWDQGLADVAGQLNCGGSELVNAEQTRKCGIDAATFDRLAALFGGALGGLSDDINSLSRLNLDIWVSEGRSGLPANVPIRFRADMAGKDASNADFSMKIEVDLTRVNDPGLTVEPPTP